MGKNADMDVVCQGVCCFAAGLSDRVITEVSRVGEFREILKNKTMEVLLVLLRRVETRLDWQGGSIQCSREAGRKLGFSRNVNYNK